jgi:hypothetical protein
MVFCLTLADLSFDRHVTIVRTIISRRELDNAPSPVYASSVMNFRRSVSDEPILSKFSAEVTISVQPTVLASPHLEGFREARDFTEIIVRQCLVQFLLPLVGGIARNL